MGRDIAEAAWTATADVTGCRIPVSSAQGSGNKFAQLAKGTKETIKKITLHWTLHPNKAKDAYYIDGEEKIPVDKLDSAFGIWKSGKEMRSPWYDDEASRRTPEDLAQEVDIDYLKSGLTG